MIQSSCRSYTYDDNHKRKDICADLNVIQWLIKIYEEKYGMYTCDLYHSCLRWNENLPVLKWIHSLGRINCEDLQGIYHLCCFFNRLETLKWLIVLVSEGFGLRRCSLNGALDVLEYIIHMGKNSYGKVDIHFDNDVAFRNALRFSKRISDYLYKLIHNKLYGRFCSELEAEYKYKE